MRTAHQHGNEISCVKVSLDNNMMASHAGDDTLKLWDLHKFTKPLAAFDELETAFNMTDCLFSPDESLIVTGTSTRRDQGSGTLVFIERSTLSKVKVLSDSSGSVIKVVWHPTLNQIVTGSSDCKSRILYNPNVSQKGALLSLSKTARKKDISDWVRTRPRLLYIGPT